MKIKVSVVQMNSGKNYRKNFKLMVDFVKRASRAGSSLVAFPEMCFYRGDHSKYKEVDTFFKNFRSASVISKSALHF